MPCAEAAATDEAGQKNAAERGAHAGNDVAQKFDAGHGDTGESGRDRAAAPGIEIAPMAASTLYDYILWRPSGNATMDSDAHMSPSRRTVSASTS